MIDHKEPWMLLRVEDLCDGMLFLAESGNVCIFKEPVEGYTMLHWYSGIRDKWCTTALAAGGRVASSSLDDIDEMMWELMDDHYKSMICEYYDVDPMTGS